MRCRKKQNFEEFIILSFQALPGRRMGAGAITICVSTKKCLQMIPYKGEDSAQPGLKDSQSEKSVSVYMHYYEDTASLDVS